MILEVLEHYFPHWDPPDDDGRTWIKCECPVHDDNNPSSSVSYELGAFTCHGCGYSGDWIKIIEQEEDCGFDDAIAIAERIADASGVEVPRRSAGKPRRGVPRLKRFGA